MRLLLRSCILQTGPVFLKHGCGIPDSCCCPSLPGLVKGLVRPASSGGDGDGDGGEGEACNQEPGKIWSLPRSLWSRRPGQGGPPLRRPPLSPLERVSNLIPRQMLNREVLQLSGQQLVGDDCGHTLQPAPGLRLPSTAGQVSFQTGDLVLVEFRRRHRLEMQKMLLLVPGGEVHSNWGMLAHQQILGHLPGQIFRTSTGSELVLRRPTLEEFVLLMKRGPAISYPKDATTMLMMMDIGDGDSVLESGSGSGAMTLFLSRAVGPSGHVYSFEVRKDHHERAKTNYQCWRNAYEVARGKEWPNNVDFINKDIVLANDDIQGTMFDAISLDMRSPQLALPAIHVHLKQGGVCAVYLANITQVIDLLEGIHSAGLPLACEKILEVVHRDWFVAPAVRKDGSTAPRVEPQRNVDDLADEEENDTAQDHGEEDDTKSFCIVPYVARPHHEQVSHTAFLTKLRKLKPALQ